MAPKKSKKKLNLVQKILGIAGVLILAEIIFLSFYQEEKPVPVRESIDKSIQALSDDPRTKEVKRLLVSLSHYASVNRGKYPQSVNQLIPVYYDKAPIDPQTGKPFAFEIRNSMPVLLGVDMGEKKTRPKPGESPSLSPEAEQQQLIATMNDEQRSDFVYDPSGKRDPFRPFDLTPKLSDADASKTELERYTIGQLKLTAVLDSFEESAERPPKPLFLIKPYG